MVGENVRKHPELLQRLPASGHTVGNHTEHHVSGWNTPTRAYLRGVQECDRRVGSRLFRPPTVASD